METFIALAIGVFLGWAAGSGSRNELDRFKNQAGHMGDRILELSEDLDQSDRQRRRCEDQNERLRSQLSKASRELKEARASRTGLESKIARLKSVASADESWKWELDALRRGQDVLREMVSQERETVTRLERELEACQNEAPGQSIGPEDAPF